MRSRKTFSKLTAFYKRVQRILSAMGAQNMKITKSVTRGISTGVCYMNFELDFDGIKKRIKLSLIPQYQGQFSILSEYRDQLVFIVRNTQVKTKDIEDEMNRVIDIWEIGNHSELLFEKIIKMDRRAVVVEKTSGKVDQHKHIDYTVYIVDFDRAQFVVSVDVKSSLIGGKLVRMRDDGVYNVNAGESAVVNDSLWATRVINEILVWEQHKLNLKNKAS